MNWKLIFKYFKNHNIQLLLVIAVVLTVFVVIIKGCSNNGYQPYSSKVIGLKAVSDLDISKVDKIIILKSDKKRILLNKDNNVWKVVNLFNYNADSKKIDSLLDALKNARIIQTLPNDPGADKRLELDILKYKPGKKSTAALIKLLALKDKMLQNIAIGKRRMEEQKGSGESIFLGRYIKSSSYEQIIFTDTQFTSTGFSKYEWLDHTFPKIKNIKSIQYSENGKTKWKLERKGVSDIFYIERNEKNKIDKDNSVTIATVLSNLDFYSVANPDTGLAVTGLKDPKTLIIETFEYQRFIIAIGNKTGNHYFLKIDAVGQPLNDIFKNWIYLVDSKRIEVLIQSKSELMKDSLPSRDGSFNLPLS